MHVESTPKSTCHVSIGGKLYFLFIISLSVFQHTCTCKMLVHACCVTADSVFCFQMHVFQMYMYMYLLSNVLLFNAGKLRC